MFRYPKSLVVALTLGGAMLAVAQSAEAQQGRTADPNMRNFYMARQQWTITDDSPMINNQMGTPGGPQQGAAPGQNGPAQLPRAGFIPYSQMMPGMSTNLPKVNNGVPPKLPPAQPVSPASMKGKAGSLPKQKAQTAKAPVQSGPQTVKSYQNYKGYTPGQAPPPVPSYQSNNGMSTNTNVQGSVLHWMRKKKGGY